MNLVAVAAVLSVAWLTFSILAFSYQLNYYVRAISKSRPQLASLRDSKDPRDAGFVASLKVANAKAASLVWVHVFLTGVGLTALIVASIPITVVTTSIGISLAGVGSIALTAKLVWLTWFSDQQYALMMAALRAERQRP